MPPTDDSSQGLRRLLPDQRGEVCRSGLAVSEEIVSGSEVSEFGFKMDDIAVTFDKFCREGADWAF
jgi:hypothetical protein